MSTLLASLRDLETAEEFLDYFEIPYEDRVLQARRLHILKRARDYLKQDDLDTLDDEVLTTRFRDVLARAYQATAEAGPGAADVLGLKHPDVVNGTQATTSTFVPLDAVLRTSKRKH